MRAGGRARDLWHHDAVHVTVPVTWAGLLPAVGGDHADAVRWLTIAGVLCAAWVLGGIVVLVTTMPRLPAAGPATTLSGPEAPAIANLLVHRWRLTTAAASATLVDLAARRHLDIDRIGDGTMLLRVRTVRARPDALTSWEQEVLSLVHARAVNGELPAPALLEGASSAWFDRFRLLVERDAVAAGLARRRFPTWLGVVFALLLALGLVPALLAADLWRADHTTVAVATAPVHREWMAMISIAVGVAAAVMVVVGRHLRGLRHTPAGQRACAHWLGVRQAFDDIDPFHSTGADGVAVWDRHLADACAVDAAPLVAATFPLAPQPAERAWSPASGLWHEVDVRFPRRPGEGTAPRSAVVNGLLFSFAAVAAVAVVTWLAIRVVGDPLLDDIRDRPLITRRVVTAVAGVVFVVPVCWSAFTLWRWAPVLFGGLADRHARTVVEGVVVKHHRRVFTRGNQEHVVTYVAVDDGRTRRVRALRWDGALPPLYSRVRVEMTPRLRHVRAITALATPPRPGGSAPLPPPRVG